ncbi:hypothetical protein QVD99_005278 [Batrachochytrium dendrobatidis]|uniref:GPI inositol-deacylase n=1 Tax=Batrachochytrium dendrobatidis (strain JEL423) TaxID=403673 RepID=A0A177WBD2_BATDL|nr:hypothetical protein O5D80_004390 [Batrachochytrium dendrobatidis]KAK5668241.1 hypothetical protein QVD99_005278 [Batrachochytrium dendrobatidis]OAJ37042.1 hypothetical protein BDEG_21115 [Batrachochytrium dendrobatidis JEL423]
MIDKVGSSVTNSQMHVGYIVAERLRAPKNPVILCHGLFGYDRIGPQSVPFLQLKYWRGIYDALQDLGCDVHIARVGSVSPIKTRAHQLTSYIDRTTPGKSVNLIAHSMGGLDCRYMVTHISPKSFRIGSITTVATPHCGSSFMDWCRDALGLGKLQRYVQHYADDSIATSILNTTSSTLCDIDNDRSWSPTQSLSSQVSAKKSSSQLSKPRSFKSKQQSDSVSKTIHFLESRDISSDFPSCSYKPVAKSHPIIRAIFSPMDAPAFTNLTRAYCAAFNQATPDDPNIYYASYAAVADVSKLAPLHFSHQIINRLEGANDGLVSLKSAQWGEFMGAVDCDHWDLVPPKVRGLTSAITGKRFDAIGLYLRMATELADRGL